MKKKENDYLKNFHFIINSLENHILNNLKTNILHEFYFIEKTSKSFGRYAKGSKIEIIDYKDASVQLTDSKSRIKDLFRDLSDEIKALSIE